MHGRKKQKKKCSVGSHKNRYICHFTLLHLSFYTQAVSWPGRTETYNFVTVHEDGEWSDCLLNVGSTYGWRPSVSLCFFFRFVPIFFPFSLFLTAIFLFELVHFTSCFLLSEIIYLFLYSFVYFVRCLIFVIVSCLPEYFNMFIVLLTSI